MKTQDDLGTTDTTNKTADTSGRESPLCELPCYAIDGYSIAADGLQGRVKSPIVYGHDHHKNCLFPLVYLGKPKWMKDEDFKKVVKSIQINMPTGTVFNK